MEPITPSASVSPFFAYHMYDIFSQLRQNNPEVSPLELIHVCEALTTYSRLAPENFHFSVILDRIEAFCDGPALSHVQTGLAADSILLLCGFFRKQSKYRGMSEFKQRLYSEQARLMYRSLHSRTRNSMYLGLSRNYGVWSDGLYKLAKQLENQKLDRLVIQ